MTGIGQNIAKHQIRYDLEIIGAGSDGIIYINPGFLDFGTITVGFAKTLSVTLSN